MYRHIDTLPGDVLIKELPTRTTDRREQFEVVRIEQTGAQDGAPPEVVAGSRAAEDRAREVVAPGGIVVRLFLDGTENLLVTRDRM